MSARETNYAAQTYFRSLDVQLVEFKQKFRVHSLHLKALKIKLLLQLSIFVNLHHAVAGQQLEFYLSVLAKEELTFGQYGPEIQL